MEAFFTSQGCPLQSFHCSDSKLWQQTKKGNKRGEGEVSIKRILINGKMETKYKLKQRLVHFSAVICIL